MQITNGKMKSDLNWYPGILLCLFTVIVSLPTIAGQKQTLTTLPRTEAAPDFSLKDIDGEIHTLSMYKGKVVVVNFWATWCPPCREELPSMQRAWKKFQDNGIVMLAIDIGEDEDTIFEFTADYLVDFPLLMDLDSSVIKQWPVRGLPTTFVVDPDGRLAYRAIGSGDWDDPGLIKLFIELQE